MSFRLSSRFGFDNQRSSTVVAYAIFFATGTAVFMPGTLLPLLAAHWRMGDGKAGIFFLCYSVGSSAGALLARGRLSYVLGTGCALTAAAATLLATPALPQMVITVYGCGLGMAMTSISLLRSRQQAKQRIAELSRLNLTWAVGAGVAPSLLLHFAVSRGTSMVLQVLAGFFAVFAILALVAIPAVARERTASMPWLMGLRAVPATLLLLIPLATGTESGTANWLSTFVLRGSHLMNVTISATTAFGIGLICSRLVYSRGGRQEQASRLILRLHPALIVTGIALLIVGSSDVLSVFAALLIGFGIGPMYPLALAMLLDHNEAGNAGFFAGGFGASVVPMVTGVVSGWTHSLRTGLLVLLVSAVAMMALSRRIAA